MISIMFCMFDLTKATQTLPSRTIDVFSTGVSDAGSNFQSDPAENVYSEVLPSVSVSN